MNSIAAYLIAHLWEDFIISSLHINLGYGIFRIFGAGLEPLMLGMTVMLDLLAHPLLDVPQAHLPAYLKRAAHRQAVITRMQPSPLPACARSAP